MRHRVFIFHRHQETSLQRRHSQTDSEQQKYHLCKAEVDFMSVQSKSKVRTTLDVTASTKSNSTFDFECTFLKNSMLSNKFKITNGNTVRQLVGFLHFFPFKLPLPITSDEYLQ